MAVAVAALAAGLGWNAQRVMAQSGTTFKVGTFEKGGQAFVGIVMAGDQQVLNLTQANTAYESKNASAKKIAMPADMKQLIARYESELRERIHAIVAEAAAVKSGLPYASAIGDLKILPPARPSVLLNAGGNYTEHTEGIAKQQQRAGGAAAAAPPPPPAVTAPGIWERKADDKRDNPYLFLKSPSVVTGANDPIRMPRGRDRIDFECEFTVVIGKPATYVRWIALPTTSSATRFRLTSRIAAVAVTARWAAPTGSSARTTTRSARSVRSSCRRSS